MINRAVPTNFEIVALNLFPVRGLQDIYLRSYKTHITPETMNAIAMATDGGQNITQTAISKVAGMMIAPSAEASSAAQIVNGWRQERYRFIIEAREMSMLGNSQTSYYIGYTDYGTEAVIHTNVGEARIAPELNFYVTSVHRLRNTSVNNQGDARVNMVGANQFLFAPDVPVDIKTGNRGMLRMRPHEVFQSNSSSALVDHLRLIPENTYDFSGSLSVAGEASNRRNNSAGTYLFDILKAYESGANHIRETGSDQESLLKEARANLPGVDSIHYDALMQSMQSHVKGIFNSGRFSFRDLERIVPHLDSVTRVFNNLNTISTMWNAENTQHWYGSDMTTVIAASIAQAFPTILLENLIADIRIDITNLTETGEFSWQIISVNAFNALLNVPVLTNRVIQRTIDELLRPMTQSGSIPIHVTIDSSIYGETMVSISFNQGPMTPYVMPTFADNGTSPILTTDQMTYEETVHGIFNVAESLIGHQAVASLRPGTMAPPQPIYTGMPTAIHPTSLNGDGILMPGTQPIQTPLY